MAHFRLSPLSYSCALALLVASGAQAASAWQALDGAKVAATSGYESRSARDYPLLASGAGSLLTTAVPGLNFVTTGSLLYAAQALNGGRIELDGAHLATDGVMAHGANLSDGQLVMRGGSISTLGDSSAGVMASGDSEVTLTDVSLSSRGRDATGVTLSQGQLTLRDSRISASGENGGGLALGGGGRGNARAVLSDVTIELSGAGTRAAIELGNGTLNGSQVAINVSDRHRGIEIYNPQGSSGRGSVTLSDSQIVTDVGDGVYTLGGDVLLNNVTVDTHSGMAVNVNNRSTATLLGGSFNTHADNAHTLWIASESASAHAQDSRFSSEGNNAHAFHAQFGNATLDNVALSTQGAGSYGLYSEAQVDAQHLTVETHGSGAIGVFAARGGNINLANTQVRTTGDSATGLLAYPGSAISGKQVDVKTEGAGAHGAWVRSGSMQLQHSTLSTAGQQAAGLLVNANSNGDSSTVTLDSTHIVSQQGAAIKVTNSNADITLTNGSQLQGGDALLDVASGTLPSEVTLNANNHIRLQGDVRVDAASRVALSLSNASQLSSSVQGADSLTLDASSQWQLRASSTLNTLHSDGNVSFAPQASGFSTLDVQTLSGNGSYHLNTDLAALQGDLIRVVGAASGDHRLGISNSGREPQQSDAALTVVTTGGGDAHFALEHGVVDAGAWQYQLEQRGQDWVLAQKHDEDQQPLPTPSAATVTALFNAAPIAWYSELTNLRTRLGEVRDSAAQGGAWTRVIGNDWRINARSGVVWRQQMQGVAMGVDSAKITGYGQRLLGVFSGISKSRLAFSGGSQGTINSFYIGGYHTWLLNDGWFADAVVKANNFSSRADARMSDGCKASGSYQTAGFGASLELGRKFNYQNGWFAEPSLQFSSLWVQGKAYRLSNDLAAKAASGGSRLATLNLTGGREMALENGGKVQPWLRAALAQELMHDNAVSVNDQRMNSNLAGQRLELGAGVNVSLTRDVALYADASWSHGDKLTSPWSGSAGLRWQF